MTMEGEMAKLSARGRTELARVEIVAEAQIQGHGQGCDISRAEWTYALMSDGVVLYKNKMTYFDGVNHATAWAVHSRHKGWKLRSYEQRRELVEAWKRRMLARPGARLA